ncbi:hypothetical protein JCM10908_003253 [Rhodotorula pacifica]|uniref:uncharacterized protein n=1 Tax=Rhodotorula pacifica TaxID=1495444 RepID=UPI0031757716
MSRQHTPPDHLSTSTQQSAEARKHQLRHRSPRGQRGRPRVGVASSSSPSSQGTSRQDGTTSGGSTSTRVNRNRDKAQLHATTTTTKPDEWVLEMWRKHRKQVTIGVAILVLILVVSAIRIAFHTADYSSAATVMYNPPITRAANRPASSRKSSAASTSLTPASSTRSSEKRKEQGKDNQEVLHEALDSAVRHALEDAWQLPPHAPAVEDVINPDTRVDGSADDAEVAKKPKPERTLAELYAELDELGISPHELNEVLDEAMRSSGDR